MNRQQLLREHIIHHCMKGNLPEGFDDDCNLIDAGILDSLALMNLIAWLEKNFSIEFEDGDIVLEHFSSINALLDFIQQKHAADEAR